MNFTINSHMNNSHSNSNNSNSGTNDSNEMMNVDEEMFFNEFIKVEGSVKEETFHTPDQNIPQPYTPDQNFSFSSLNNNNNNNNKNNQLSYRENEQQLFEEFLRQNQEQVSPFAMRDFPSQTMTPTTTNIVTDHQISVQVGGEVDKVKEVDSSKKPRKATRKKISTKTDSNNNISTTPSGAPISDEVTTKTSKTGKTGKTLKTNKTPKTPKETKSKEKKVKETKVKETKVKETKAKEEKIKKIRIKKTNESVDELTTSTDDLVKSADEYMRTIDVYKEQCFELIKSMEYGRTTELDQTHVSQIHNGVTDTSNTTSIPSGGKKSVHLNNENAKLQYQHIDPNKLPFKLEILPLPEKSRVETQVKVSFKISPSPPLNIIHISNYCLSKQKNFLKNDITTYPEHLRKQILYLDAEVISSTTNKPAFVCDQCLKREQRRSSRRKSGTSDINLWCNSKNRKMIVFTSKQLTLMHTPTTTGNLNLNMIPPSTLNSEYTNNNIDVNSNGNGNGNGNGVSRIQNEINMEDSEMDLDFKQFELSSRLVCYCRHHKEPVGFKIIFVLKNYTGTVVAKTVSSIIKLIDKEPTKHRTRGSVSDASHSLTSDENSSIYTDFSTDRQSSFDISSVSASDFDQFSEASHFVNELRFDTTTSDLLQQNSPSHINSALNLNSMANISSLNMSMSNVGNMNNINNINNINMNGLNNMDALNMNMKMDMDMDMDMNTGMGVNMNVHSMNMNNIIENSKTNSNSALANSIGREQLNMIKDENMLSPSTSNDAFNGVSNFINQDALKNHSVSSSSDVIRESPYLQSSVPETQQHLNQQQQQQQHFDTNTQIQNISFNSSEASLPSIQRIIPAQGPVTGGSEVTILGTNFKPGMLVKFGENRALSANCWSSNTIIAYSPPASIHGQVIVSVFEEEYEHIAQQINMVNPNPNAIFTYVDETDRQLIELALQIVGLKMSGKVEDARNIAKRIVTDTSGSESSASNTQSNGASPYVQYNNNNNNQQALVSKIIKMVNNTTTNLSLCNENGQTLLHLACLKGYIELIILLVKRGARIEVGDKYGFTPLHFACLNGDIRIMKILMACKADPGSPTCTKELLTPVEVFTINHSLALKEDYKECVQVLTAFMERKSSLSSMDSDLLDNDSIYSNGSGFQVHVSKMINDNISDDSDPDYDDSSEYEEDYDDEEEVSEEEDDDDEVSVRGHTSDYRTVHDSSSTEDQQSNQSTESLPPQYEDLFPSSGDAYFDQEPENFSILKSLKQRGGFSMHKSGSLSLQATPIARIVSDVEECTDIGDHIDTLRVHGMGEPEADIEEDEDFENLINIKFIKQRQDFSSDKMLLFFWIPFMLIMVSSFLIFRFGSTDNKLHHFSEKSSEWIRIWLTKIVLGNKRMQTVFKDAFQQGEHAFKEVIQNKGEMLKEVFQQAVKETLEASTS